jgi:esterase FrsA
MEVLRNETSTPIYHCGPDLQAGPLPTLFYFALSGYDSLLLDPYNQPVVALADQAIRVVSLTIPGHGNGFDNLRAMDFWADQLKSNHDLISPFIAQCVEALDYLIAEGYTNPDHVGAAGLSRGGFIAAHFAAQDERVKTVLGFSPLTQLEEHSAFKTEEAHPIIQRLSLTNLTERLADKTVRAYIGNRDTSVGTAACFHWIHNLTEAAYLHKHRSPPIELIIYPSIGHKGHGTPPHIFQAGAQWIAQNLLSVET